MVTTMLNIRPEGAISRTQREEQKWELRRGRSILSSGRLENPTQQGHEDGGVFPK